MYVFENRLLILSKRFLYMFLEEKRVKLSVMLNYLEIQFNITDNLTWYSFSF